MLIITHFSIFTAINTPCGRSCINLQSKKQLVLTIASAQDVVNFRDFALECVNTDHVLSEIIADANEEKCNSNVKSFCDPQFQSIGQVHIYFIYYHMSNNQLTKSKLIFFISYNHFWSTVETIHIQMLLFHVNHNVDLIVINLNNLDNYIIMFVNCWICCYKFMLISHHIDCQLLN